VLEKIRQSLVEHPRELWLIYVAPGRKERLLDAAEFLVKAGKNESPRYCCIGAGEGTGGDARPSIVV